MPERPIITVREWAQQHGVPERTALYWASTGHLPAYQSPPGQRGTWLTRTDQPRPPAPPQGAAAHRKPTDE